VEVSDQFNIPAALNSEGPPPPRHPLERRLDRTLSKSKLCEEEKNNLPFPGIEFQPSTPSLYLLNNAGNVFDGGHFKVDMYFAY
jgi:hypothetical protein